MRLDPEPLYHVLRVKYARIFVFVCLFYRFSVFFSFVSSFIYRQQALALLKSVGRNCERSFLFLMILFFPLGIVYGRLFRLGDEQSLSQHTTYIINMS